jgi:phosphonate transport system substrate-binding protein
MNLVPDANLADARAAMALWMGWAARAASIHVDAAPGVFIPSRELLELIRRNRVDAFALDVLEYRQVADCIDPRWMVTSSSRTSDGAQFVLVTRRDAGFRSLADLRGKRLLRWQAPATRLSEEWLAVEQARAGGPPDARFWGQTAVENKLPRVVLPVFFRQHEACLVARDGFAAMCEMNPQVELQMQVIARSEPMVAGGYFFHKHCPPSAREGVISAFSRLDQLSFGKQLLVLFQTPALVVRDLGCLRPALELAREYDRVRAASRPRSGR